LEEEDRKVKNAAATWRMEIGPTDAVTLAAGETAFFGTAGTPLIAIDVPHNEDGEHGPNDEHGDNTPLQMWINAEDVVTLYEDAIGPWSSPSLSRPKVVVRYPAAESNSNANATRMAITWGHRKKWNVFLHEFGHYFAQNDASTLGFANNYCLDKTDSTWPFSESPYSYEDPDAPDPPAPFCGHKDWSFEKANTALSEGFADFTRYILIDNATSVTGARYCSRWPGRRLDDVGGPAADIPRNAHFYNSVNFDGEQNETNVAQTLCDLVDDEFESVTYLHQFGDEGHLTSLDLGDFVPNPLSTVGMNATHAFSAQGTDIFQVEFSTGGVSFLFDAATPSDVKVVAADANQVCASDGVAVNCFVLATAGPVAAIALPSSVPAPIGVRDMQLSGGNLFVMTEHGGASAAVRLYRYDAAVPAWQLLYSEAVAGRPPAEWPRRFAVGGASSGAKLFLARAQRVEVCDSSNCAPTLTHYAGDVGGAAGYRRGDLSTALLNSIGQLVRIPGGTTLRIVDQYGVSEIEDGDTRLRQWIGRGLDRVFENNISRRGLVLGSLDRDWGRIDLSVKTLYATNGAHEIVLDNQGTDFALDRQKVQSVDDNDSSTSLDDEPNLTRGYLIDASVPTTDRLFCAEENVSIDPEDVFTMFDGNPYGSSILDALANYLSLTAAEESAVAETSWVSLSPPGNCEHENIRRERTDIAGSGPPPDDPVEGDECGGYVEPDSGDLSEDGFFDAQLVIGPHEEEENPEPIDESALPVFRGSDCSGSGEDPNDGDGVCHAFDNCPLAANSDQLDTDGDSQGDVCDEDDDGDGYSDDEELAGGSDPLDPQSTPDPVGVPMLGPAGQTLLFGLLGVGGLRAILRRGLERGLASRK
jgi:hypothetical protein